MSEPLSSRTKTMLAYAALLVVSALGLVAVHRFGAALEAPAPAPGAALFGDSSAPHQAGTLLQVLLALLVIVAASRVFGLAFRGLAQPPVVGEVIAGIALGPSLLGALARALADLVRDDGADGGGHHVLDLAAAHALAAVRGRAGRQAGRGWRPGVAS
jgi:hypothetical protein